jgi:hypothetical protein
VHDPAAFAAIVQQAKDALPASAACSSRAQPLGAGLRPCRPGACRDASTKNPKVAEPPGCQAPSVTRSPFLVEGAQGVREALAAGPPAIDVFVDDELHELAVAAQERGSRSCTPRPRPRPADLHRHSARDRRCGVLCRRPRAGPGLGCVAVLREVRDPGTRARRPVGRRRRRTPWCSGPLSACTTQDGARVRGSIFHLPISATSRRSPRSGAAGERVPVPPMDAHGLPLYDRRQRPGGLRVRQRGARPAARGRGRRRDGARATRGRGGSLNLTAAATICLFEHARPV